METAFEATTNEITVRVRVTYLHQHSEPASRRYLWAYYITLTNHRPEAVQLLKRSWEIIDANGYTQRVHGEGVVGKQPTLQPSEQFTYNSAVPLGTSTGFMVGTYHMLDLTTGDQFDIAVPAFSLDSPFQAMERH